MRMNFERRKTGLERKIKLLSESLVKEKKTRAGMKESELFIFVLDFNLKQYLLRHLATDYTVPGVLEHSSSWVNHVMYDHGACFVRVIMSSSCALCCLPSMYKQSN